MAMQHSTKDDNAAPPRVIQPINIPTVHDNIINTLVTLRFKQPNDGIAINIPHKHQKLFQEMKKVDSTVQFIDNSDKVYNEPSDIPRGETYSNVFNIDTSHRKEGFIYVTTKLRSTISVNKFKYGETNVMQFLHDNSIFLHH